MCTINIFNINVAIQQGETIVYSGRNDEKHHGGVAILMNRNVTKAMLEYAPVNEWIIRARFQAKQEKLTSMQCWCFDIWSRCWRENRFLSSSTIWDRKSTKTWRNNSNGWL